ncbi:MAG: hypothetical protein RIR26_1980 [Pseudomonadota bacterium]
MGLKGAAAAGRRSVMLITTVCIFNLSGCINSFQNRIRIGAGARSAGKNDNKQSAAPVSAPTVTSVPFDLQEAIRTSRSVLILAIGFAEGTIGLDGSPTSAYYGHGDSGLRNVGIFSCVSCGQRGPEEADAFFLEERVKPQLGRFQDAARAALLPSSHPMLAAAFFTLLVQSPEAATGRKGFLDRMSGLKMLGITMDNLIQLCVDSFRDPDSNRFEDVARFDNDETRIRTDQRRRLMHAEQFLSSKGVETFPHY